MELYRITKEKYSEDISGRGAELYGGRWNSIGIPALYTSENRALGALELLVHTPKGIMPPKYILVTLEIPEYLVAKITQIDVQKLKFKWDSLRESDKSQELGRKYFIEKGAFGIRVPSTIIKSEFNIVLNPRHEDYKVVKIIKKERFLLDKRLIE